MKPEVAAETLLPCPFCGCAPKLEVNDPDAKGDAKQWSVQCVGPKCHIEPYSAGMKQEWAVEEWNIRAISADAASSQALREEKARDQKSWSEALLISQTECVALRDEVERLKKLVIKDCARPDLKEEIAALRKENEELQERNDSQAESIHNFDYNSMCQDGHRKVVYDSAATDMDCPMCALQRQKAALREALAHAHHRNHPHTEWCDGCKKIDAALALADKEEV